MENCFAWPFLTLNGIFIPHGSASETPGDALLNPPPVLDLLLLPLPELPRELRRCPPPQHARVPQLPLHVVSPRDLGFVPGAADELLCLSSVDELQGGEDVAVRVLDGDLAPDSVVRALEQMDGAQGLLRRRGGVDEGVAGLEGYETILTA